MTEAVAPVLEFAFNSVGFEKLVFANAVGNARSRRVKEKTGAHFVEVRPAKFVDPTYTEHEIWELTKEAWTLSRRIEAEPKADATIDKATLEDVSEVARVFRTSRQQALPYLPMLHSADEDLAYFNDFVFKNDEVYVARDSRSGNAVGFIAFNQEFVVHLYTLPDAQKCGVGTRLLKLAQEFSDHLKLWTFQKNTDAQVFYAKRGFRVVEITDGSGNEEKEPDVLMEWNR